MSENLEDRTLELHDHRDELARHSAAAISELHSHNQRFEALSGVDTGYGELERIGYDTQKQLTEGLIERLDEQGSALPYEEAGLLQALLAKRATALEQALAIDAELGMKDDVQEAIDTISSIVPEALEELVAAGIKLSAGDRAVLEAQLSDVHDQLALVNEVFEAAKEPWPLPKILGAHAVELWIDRYPIYHGSLIKDEGEEFEEREVESRESFVSRRIAEILGSKPDTSFTEQQLADAIYEEGDEDGPSKIYFIMYNCLKRIGAKKTRIIEEMLEEQGLVPQMGKRQIIRRSGQVDSPGGSKNSNRLRIYRATSPDKAAQPEVIELVHTDDGGALTDTFTPVAEQALTLDQAHEDSHEHSDVEQELKSFREELQAILDDLSDQGVVVHLTQQSFTWRFADHVGLVSDNKHRRQLLSNGMKAGIFTKEAHSDYAASISYWQYLICLLKPQFGSLMNTEDGLELCIEIVKSQATEYLREASRPARSS